MTSTVEALNGSQQLAAVRLVAATNQSGTYFNGPLNNGVQSTFTYATGVLTIDSVVANLNDYILIAGQTLAYQNGIYQVTTAGAVGVSAVLQRRGDLQCIEQLRIGHYVPVGAGTVYGGSMWTLIEPKPAAIGVPIVSGANNIEFATITASGSGLFLEAANNLSDVASAPTSATNLGLGTTNTPIFHNVQLSSSTGVTAHSGGGQASATLLTGALNTVVTVAADGDSVKLPPAVAGQAIVITNGNVLHSIQVFGSGTDVINGVATAIGVPQLPDVSTTYYSTTNGVWLTSTFPTNSVSSLIATVPLTAAQFNGMYAAPVQLIAAPGANMMISVDKVVLQMTFGSADFASGGVVAAQYGNTIHGAGTAATNTEAAADFFAAASTVFQFNGISGNTVGALPTANVSNAGIFLSNATGAFTTGDSTFIAKVYYKLVNLAGNF